MGYALGRGSDGERFPWSPPTALLLRVDPEQYRRLERPEIWGAHGLPHDFPLRVGETIADASLVGYLLDRARADDHPLRGPASPAGRVARPISTP